MSESSASVGIIGGSGLYRLLDDAERVAVDTPWGEPSDLISIGEVEGRRVAFLPRHGPGHTIPPHRINARANVWALHHLGVRRLVAPCAVGSLRAEHGPGDVVVCDQFINLSAGRADTYFEGPDVAHLSAAEPYCEELRRLAGRALGEAGMRATPRGTVVVIDGPRFATRAESRLFASFGGDVVNMTQYPEVVLARELGLCYVGLAVVTDRDAGMAGSPELPAVTQEAVLDVFRRSIGSLREALRRLVVSLPEARGCTCPAAPQTISH